MYMASIVSMQEKAAHASYIDHTKISYDPAHSVWEEHAYPGIRTSLSILKWSDLN